MKCPDCEGTLLVWESRAYEIESSGRYFRDPQSPEIVVRCLTNDCPIDDQFGLEEEGGGFARIVHEHTWLSSEPVCPCGAEEAGGIITYA